MGSWKRFSLSESEGNKFSVQEEYTGEEHLLAAKFFTRRVLNMEAIARTFTLLWKTRKGFEIRDLGDHKILFVFPEKADVDRVLEGEPWSFDRHLVVLQRIERDDVLRSMDFSVTRFWVQVHDMPIGSSSLDLAKEFGSVVGKVENRMTDEGDQYGVNFIRLRVAVDIRNPICRGRMFSTARGKEGWVNFRYERLPNICYWCGRLTHGDRECPLWIKSRGTLKDEDQQFGAWLRATAPNPFKKTIIRVPGLDEEGGWDSNERHGEKDKEGCSSKEDDSNGNGLEVNQATVQNMEETGAIHARVADRDEFLKSPELRGTQWDSPTNVESMSLHRRDDPVQKTLFQEQLEEIDQELSKFDSVVVNGDVAKNSEIVAHQQENEGREKNGLGSLGLASSLGAVIVKGKNKERGWVRKERNMHEPTGQMCSILSKRAFSELNAEGENTEESKKKVAKSDDALSVEAGSQPRRNQ